MKQSPSTKHRILGVALSTRGFGFAVMEGQAALIECGVKVVQGDKNIESLAKIEMLIKRYQPDVLVLQDVNFKGSRRAPRIRKLHGKVIKQAGKRKLKVKQFSRTQMHTLILGKPIGIKHEMAEVLASQFPDELASRLPAKRKPWKSEDARMDIFEAVCLAVTFQKTMHLAL